MCVSCLIAVIVKCLIVPHKHPIRVSNSKVNCHAVSCVQMNDAINLCFFLRDAPHIKGEEQWQWSSWNKTLIVSVYKLLLSFASYAIYFQNNLHCLVLCFPLALSVPIKMNLFVNIIILSIYSLIDVFFLSISRELANAVLYWPKEQEKKRTYMLLLKLVL